MINVILVKVMPQLEKWPSGLRRHPAKVLYGVTCTVGSNPTFSELKSGYILITGL